LALIQALKNMSQIKNPALSPSIQSKTGVEFINTLIPNLITIGFIIASVVAVIFLIVGGIRWITSGGDREATAKARSTITSALIGLALVLGVYGLLSLIGYFFEIDLIRFDIAPLILK
jgi:hypothetical protein